jgi:hypothetical protein
MATYKGIGYESSSATYRTGTASDDIEFDSLITATDGITVTGALTSTTLSVTGDASIGGDLDVTGDIISRGAVNLVVEDNFIDLNFGNTTTTSEAGGLTISMNRTTGFTSGMVTTFVAGAAGVSNPTFTNTDATGSSLLAVADIVMITEATQQGNNGLYQVITVSGASFPQTVTIAGTGTTAVDGSLPFCQTQFEAETGATAVSSKIDLAVWAVADGTNNFLDAAGANYAKGTFVTAYATSAVLSDFDGAGDYTTASSTLQSAYDGGQTITTANGSGPIAITFDTNSSGMTMDGDVAGVGDVTMGVTNTINTFTVDAAGAISLDAGASSNLDVAGTGATLTLGTSGGGVNRTIVNSAGTGTNAITLNASAGGVDIDALTAVDILAATTLSAKGATGASVGDDTGTWEFDGSGNLTETGMVAVTITPSDAMTLTAGAASTWSTGAGALTITSAAACTWSTAAGVLTIDGKAGLDLDSDGAGSPINLGTEAVAKTITIGNAASAEVQIDAIRVDINAVANGFQIDGAGNSNLSTSGTGTLTIDSAGALAIDTDGTDAIDIGIEAVAKTITIGNDASAKVDVNAAEIELDSAGPVIVDAVGNIDVISSTGNVDISSDTATQKVSITSNFVNLMRTMTAIDPGGYTAGDCLYGFDDSGVLTVGKANADAAATSQFIGVGLTTTGAGASGKVIFGGIVKTVTGDASYASGSNLGKQVFLSTTAGKISLTPPSAPGDVIFQVGICVGGTGTAWEVLLQPRFVMEIG